MAATCLAGAVLAFGLAGCNSEPPAPFSERPVVQAPADDRAALEACLAAAGYTVHPAQRGSNNVYSWEGTSRFTWDHKDVPENFVASEQCAARFAPPREWTAAELRVTYDRWVLEAQCLVSLGFHPQAPPPFTTFVEDWKTGPWMPIDGVPFQRLNEAKDLCGLEMAD